MSLVEGGRGEGVPVCSSSWSSNSIRLLLDDDDNMLRELPPDWVCAYMYV